MGTSTKVVALSEIPVGTCKMVHAGGQDVALYNVDGQVYATANACPHRGGSLAEGLLEGKLITCPWHGWQWDVATGCLSTHPAAKVPTFPAKVENGDIFIEI